MGILSGHKTKPMTDGSKIFFGRPKDILRTAQRLSPPGSGKASNTLWVKISRDRLSDIKVHKENRPRVLS